jgi:hypothetical protein
MRQIERALMIAGGTWVAALTFGGLFALALLPPERVTLTNYFVTLVGALALGLVAGAASWRVDDGRRSAAWPERPPSVRFSNAEPESWLDFDSPRAVIGQIEGSLLHRRLGLALPALVTNGTPVAPLDGLPLRDGGAAFQAVVGRLSAAKEEKPARWLIIVRDPSRAGDVCTVDECGNRLVRKPSVLAAVATLTRGERNWDLSVEELHALDARYVAECALWAWFDDGVDLPRTVTAELDSDGITWLITLHVPASEGNASIAMARVAAVLKELRVPFEVFNSAVARRDGE